MREIRTNKTFTELSGSDTKISVFQGGARSGKTYNILIWLILKAASTKDHLTIDIVRQTLPALKGSAYRDFVEILDRLDMFDERDLNKSELIYRINNTLFQFISIDQPQKYRGRKRNILFINEANEITLEAWRQLAMRTTDKIILDYNPSMEYHWIYDEVIPRDDCDTWITTYKDNKFLSEDLVFEIERMKERRPERYKAVIEGNWIERSEGVIYTNWKLGEFQEVSPAIFGADFGFSQDENVLLKTSIDRDRKIIYVQLCFYLKALTTSDLRTLYRKHAGDSLIIADSSEVRLIHELKNTCNILPSIKGQGSVTFGIAMIQDYDLVIHNDDQAVHLVKELNNYIWLDRKSNTPIDKYNHALDSLRYAISYQLKNPNIGNYNFF
jgi:phage terminase large subunit